MFARGQCTLQASHSGSLGSHSLGDLRLRQPGFLSRLEQDVQHSAFFSFDALNFLADACTPAFMRLRAISFLNHSAFEGFRLKT